MPFSLKACDHTFTGVPTHDVSNFLKSRFGDHRLIKNSKNIYDSLLKYKQFGLFDISEHRYGSSVLIDVPPLNNIYHFQIILSGECTWTRKGEGILLQYGDSVILSPNDEYSMDYSADCRKLIVKIPREFMQQSAREFGYIPSSTAIRFHHQALPFVASAPIHNLLGDILDRKNSPATERASLYYAKLLANVILDTYENDLVHRENPVESGHRHLEPIRNHILDHITEDISIEQLANVCRISRKSLYNLFEREMKITPSAYIRQLKLEAIYGELASKQGIRNVTEVALKYGFVNLGRFSAQYRNQIGELPSETLKRLDR